MFVKKYWKNVGQNHKPGLMGPGLVAFNSM
jgi:hypothetical protein